MRSDLGHNSPYSCAIYLPLNYAITLNLISPFCTIIQIRLCLREMTMIKVLEQWLWFHLFCRSLWRTTQTADKGAVLCFRMSTALSPLWTFSVQGVRESWEREHKEGRYGNYYLQHGTPDLNRENLAIISEHRCVSSLFHKHLIRNIGADNLLFKRIRLIRVIKAYIKSNAATTKSCLSPPQGRKSVVGLLCI